MTWGNWCDGTGRDRSDVAMTWVSGSLPRESLVHNSILAFQPPDFCISGLRRSWAIVPAARELLCTDLAMRANSIQGKSTLHHNLRLTCGSRNHPRPSGGSRWDLCHPQQSRLWRWILMIIDGSELPLKIWTCPGQCQNTWKAARHPSPLCQHNIAMLSMPG